MASSSRIFFLIVLIFILQSDAFLSEWSLRAPCDDQFYHESTNSERADDDFSCSVFLEKKHSEETCSEFPMLLLLVCLAAIGLYAYREISARDRVKASQATGEIDAQSGLMTRLKVRWWDEQPGFSLQNWQRSASCHRLKRL